ncbi:MAG: dethiobiotin synthase [Synergistaceae bacterium]|nr:dethiobiotin synthase [Synergistaceae bacterium]MBQ3397613.1 dethiobiotin synthase [Synergistaceae bacterium]MBQ6664391.1 dethiobiotin synthase [Synergistaceae bacterium]MBR0185414.1 dethiobiotin synthase [Synergistaceae bacterium]MBR0247901.1 dethiobiotin synthase [Synergistaceae bacterium]
MTEDRNIFIVGTGTDVGKTYIAGLILKEFIRSGINAAYFKAAMSGNIRDSSGNLIPGDALHVKEVSGTTQPLSEMCPYVYERAYSPHLAARIEGNPVNFDAVMAKFDALSAKYDRVIMEGSGGILCPIRLDGEKEIWLEDFVRARDFGCVLVADAGLGTINAVGLTVSYMKAKGMRLTGIIFNRFQPGNILHEDNLKVCEYLTGLKVIACVKENDSDITGGIE